MSKFAYTTQTVEGASMIREPECEKWEVVDLHSAVPLARDQLMFVWTITPRSESPEGLIEKILR